MLGPLAWHIIRAPRVSIFFLDPEQGFRDRENTATEDIQSWALASTLPVTAASGPRLPMPRRLSPMDIPPPHGRHNP